MMLVMALMAAALQSCSDSVNDEELYGFEDSYTTNINYTGKWTYKDKDMGSGTVMYNSSTLVIKDPFSWQFAIDEWMEATGETGWKEDPKATKAYNEANGIEQTYSIIIGGYSIDSEYFTMPVKVNQIGVLDADGKQWWMRIEFENGKRNGVGMVNHKYNMITLVMAPTSIEVFNDDSHRTVTIVSETEENIPLRFTGTI